MTSRAGGINLSYQELKALCGERENLVHTLREQLRTLEMERDQLRQAVEYLTDGLRRRGCCDHDANGNWL